MRKCNRSHRVPSQPATYCMAMIYESPPPEIHVATVQATWRRDGATASSYFRCCSSPSSMNGAVFSFFSSSPSLLDGSTLHGDLISSPVLHHLIVIGRHDFVSSSPSFHFEKLPSSLAILRVVSVEQSPLSLTSLVYVLSVLVLVYVHLEQRVFEETQESRDLESNKYWLPWRV
ncbi:hypothetical protein HID58_034118 [Brassica napus]|uniref:Uncharacterized protein n=1 Tax=Brassica napus TaxID=3708 RepID=A0ABQ8C165_BRANA|nr:hypothetical protein HID58_034118 [Brassica napus]